MTEENRKSENSKAQKIYVSGAIIGALFCFLAWPVTTYQIPKTSGSAMYIHRGIVLSDIECHPSNRDAVKRYERYYSELDPIPRKSTPGFEACWKPDLVGNPEWVYFRFGNVLGSVYFYPVGWGARSSVKASDEEIQTLLSSGVAAASEFVDSVRSERGYAVTRARFAYYWDRKIAPEIEELKEKF